MGPATIPSRHGRVQIAVVQDSGAPSPLHLNLGQPRDRYELSYSQLPRLSPKEPSQFMIELTEFLKRSEAAEKGSMIQCPSERPISYVEVSKRRDGTQFGTTHCCKVNQPKLECIAQFGAYFTVQHKADKEKISPLQEGIKNIIVEGIPQIIYEAQIGIVLNTGRSVARFAKDLYDCGTLSAKFHALFYSFIVTGQVLF